MFINSPIQLKWYSVLSMLLISMSALAQTVTNVSPTRVTTNSVITISGTGFNSSTSINLSGIAITGLDVISSNEIVFEISEAGNSDLVSNLNVANSVTDFDISYVAPRSKSLRNGTSSNVEKITEIFTNYNGFWRSSDWKANPADLSLWPNSRHELLAFTYNGTTYSTGVDDALLNSNGVNFSDQLFYAYTTDGVSGVTQSSNYIAMGDLVDGEVNESGEINSPEVLGSTVYDVLIDGINGLDLGTGITNFNQNTDVQFYSAGGILGAIDDDIPDLLITQIARAGSTDVYYYSDAFDNIVGRPLKLQIFQEEPNDGDALLAKWRLDLYNLNIATNYGVATPTSRAFSRNETRPLRMAAFKFEDFGITAANIDDINNINMVAGGTADLAFLAYNRGSFDIKTPVVTQFPLSRNICEVPGTTDITLVAAAAVSGGATGAAAENLSYQWFKFNEMISGANSPTYTVEDVDLDDLALYRLRVSNDFGAFIVTATISEGGTPVFWNGTEFELPPAYLSAGITSVPDEQRELVFTADYNESGDLEACDCTVGSNTQVTIPSGSNLKLFKEVTVQSGGRLTFEDGANLIQIKDVVQNNNLGNINVEREVNNLESDDFVFWSSPVENFQVSNITSPSASLAFQWDVNALNGNGVAGDWTSASGIMAAAEGYIVETPNDLTPSFTADFRGVPRNGTIDVDVVKSPNSNQPAIGMRHWNLIGNPYPSSINAHKLFEANAQIEGHLRIWTHNPNISNASNPFYTGEIYNYNSEYITSNVTGATPPNLFNGNIASGQAFFVQVLDNAPQTSSVNFSNNLRFDNDGNAYDNSNFFRGEKDISTVIDDNLNRDLIWLSLVDSNNRASSTLVGYVEGATNEKDRLYDTYSEDLDFKLFSLIGTEQMNIQGRAFPFSDDDTVAMGITLSQNGTYTIGIDQLQGSEFGSRNTPVVLEDTFLDIDTNLLSNSYTFTADAGTTTNRFVLKYTSDQLSVKNIEQNEVSVFIMNDMLQVESTLAIINIEIYDISGKNLLNYEPKPHTKKYNQQFAFSRGTYLVVITAENGRKYTKKVMN